MNNSFSQERSTFLDIVRGLAALSVFLSHWLGYTLSQQFDPSTTDRIIGFIYQIFRSLLHSESGAHPGVIVFIVLSGFCIHNSTALNPAWAGGKSSWKLFFCRRFFRIIPLYWFALILGFFVFLTEDGGSLSKSVLNIPLKITLLTPLFLSHQVPLGNGPLATVEVEMWIYISYPLILALRRKIGWLGVFSFAIILHLFAIGLLWCGVATPASIANSYFIFLMYWCIGAFSAELLRKKEKKSVLCWIMIYLLILYLVLANSLHFRGFHFIKSILLSLIVGDILCTYTLIASLKQNLKYSNFLKMWAAGLGRVSYSLYVVHAPTLALAGIAVYALELTEDFTKKTMTLSMVLVATYLTYRFVEKPITQYSKTFKNPK